MLFTKSQYRRKYDGLIVSSGTHRDKTNVGLLVIVINYLILSTVCIKVLLRRVKLADHFVQFSPD